MNQDIKKVIELLREIHPNDSEKELEEKATNLWEIALFLIRYQIKTHSNTSKPHTTELLQPRTEESPPKNLQLFKTDYYRRDEFG